MKSTLAPIRSLLAALVLALCAIGATSAAPLLTAPAVALDYFVAGGDGDLSGFGADVVPSSDVPVSGVAKLSIGLSYSLADPATAFGGGLFIADDAGTVLDGDLIALTFDVNTIRFTLAGLGGTAASLFGGQAMGVITFDPILGGNPLTLLQDGQSYKASISLTSVVGTVAEPPMLALVLLSLAISGTLARRGAGQR
jgi:hypothetical protein